MGEYVKQGRTLNGRSVYMGGSDGDMVLYSNKEGWAVTTEDRSGGSGLFMHTNDSASTPDHIKATWIVSKGYQPAPSLRVCEFGGRELVLEVSGLPVEHVAASCMGQYKRDTCSYNDKPAYKGSQLADGMAIWFSNGKWRIGPKEDIATDLCFISAEECARTPDAVQFMWRVIAAPEFEKRVQVCSVSVQQSSTATAHETHQQSSAPRKLAVVGSRMECDSYDGIYTKQLREVSSRAVYEGGWNGKQAIWYHQTAGARVACATADIGTGKSFMNTQSPAVTPDSVTGPWSVPLTMPCSSIRVTKSNKKHTKVIEVKGAPTDGEEELAQMNGKYRRSSRLGGGKPMFKGGQDGSCAFWFDESHGKWRGGHVDWDGTGGCNMGGYNMEATDKAAAPNAVKAVWHVFKGFAPSPFPNVIIPSVEAAEQEVPRLVRLKMSELVVAQHMKCLGCGHEYTAQVEVMFQTTCMHHHCVCCGEEHGEGVCAVCANEKAGTEQMEE
jgi:hypothetical protein